MENIILTNNKDLRLVGVKVGVYSTLRFELPLVPESATHVEVIVTSGGVHSAYTATFVSATKFWQCDIAASQFPTVGKQSYEVAYVLDGKQFWDGKGWIEIEDATTSGIEPQPRPEPYRYTVLSVNGYGADAQGAVRIPKTFIATDSPATTDGFMEGDIYFNRLTGAAWTLCNVLGTLTWVFNYKNYYTKAETDEAIDKLAAYYITYNAAGAAFPTRADLLNAQTYYSGGAARVPTRNDYAVVLADEAHGGAEWRYIYAVADGQTQGQWEAQYPIETNDYDALSNKPSINGVTLSGNKTGPDLGIKNNFEIGSGLQEVINNLYAYAGVDGTSTEGQTVYTLGVVASVGSKLYTWDGTTLTDTLKTVSSVNVGTGRIYTSMIPAVYYERAASNDVSRPPTVNVATVAPSPNAVAGNVADAKSVWDELLKLAPDWKTSTAGGSYVKYDVVRYNHNYYYNKTGTNTNTIPSGDTTNWGSLANLAALAHQFLPLAGGAITGNVLMGGVLEFISGGSVIIRDGMIIISDDHGVTGTNFYIQGIRTPNHNAPLLFPNYTDEDYFATLENIASDFSTSATYALNALCAYNGVLYRCTNANGHMGAWAAGDFAAATVEDVLAALRGKFADYLPLAGGTMTGDLTARNLISQIRAVSIGGAVGGAKFILQGASDEHYIQFAYQNSKYGLFVKNGANDAGTFYALADFAPLASPAFTGTPTATTPTAGDSSTKVATTAFVQGENNAKLDSTSAAPAFSTSSTYAVGEHVTYNGALYRCTTAVTTAGAWDASKWTADMASNYFQYALVTKTIANGAVTLDDRAINAVAVSSSLASLTVNFPTATSGRVRDFGLRLTVASGVTTAPELALPQGVTCENADGAAPEIGADGAATILYFTETASGVFLVKGEVITAIS